MGITLKQQIIDNIIAIEGNGEYSDRPADSGGPTRWGVTETTARAFGYTGDIRELPRETAYEIFSKQYWDSINGDGLAALSESVAREVVDTGINCGTETAAHFLQRALNVFNRRAALYPDITCDGDIGGETLSALRAYLKTRSDVVLCRALNCLQGAYYIQLAERREKDEENVYGWLNARVSL